MAEQVTINLRHVARGLGLPLRQVEAAVELLDEGNTVPFITRYRKDATGGLDEEAVRQIQGRLVKLRLLAERKQTILRSIEAQGKLTEELGKQILEAGTTKRLEDLYLPFKPKKQTLATLARSRGLELLATEILNGAPSCADLDARAADFVNPDRQVPTAADALLGAGHILAELFSEKAELRQRLREILQRSGKLVSTRVGAEARPSAGPGSREAAAAATGVPAGRQGNAITISGVETAVIGALGELAMPNVADTAASLDDATSNDMFCVAETASEAEIVNMADTAMPGEMGDLGVAGELTDSIHVADTVNATDNGDLPTDQDRAEKRAEEEDEEEEEEEAGEEAEADRLEGIAQPAAAPNIAENVPSPTEPGVATVEQADQAAAEPVGQAEARAESAASTEPTAAPTEAADPVAVSAEPVAACAEAAAAAPPNKPAARETRAARQAKLKQKQAKKELKKKKAEERRQRAFSDYFDYTEEIRKIPPHRVLAINRGERAKVIRVRMECDLAAMDKVLEELCVPAGHPHADFLRGCARDALTRLILPSLERDIRRELTERAETHAVGVFARNLRNLLLQPPARDRRVLALDPGYKSGCKLAALDQFGNLLDHGVFYLVGKPERKQEARQTILSMIEKHQLSVVAIGNGTGCRETENLVADIVGNELKDKGVCYVIVNEAGASVYSTSRIGREELPGHDASLRGAISIGRRLQDPLSELVKIDPDSIGVGLYQHDVKAKHLRASLDEVVESCVNFVGVDVNTASPALLRYVSGLNQLTARRLYEHRLQHGPFSTREQLKEVPGFGEVTFVQAAGFLKIVGGANPLDATWIHPESYEIAGRVMAKLNCTPADLAAKEAGQPTAGQLPRPDATALAAELQVGTLLLKDILAQLARPGRDPREDLPAPVFKRGILKLEDLATGMELTGTVLNVVDFGAFVDIGMHDSGLVHVSHMADRFIRDPHDVVAVGDIVRVWVLDVDKQRRRVSLTMVRPGSERGPQRPRSDSAEASSAGGAAGQKPRAQQRRPSRPQQGGPRPPRPQGQGQGRPRTQVPPRTQFKPRTPPKPIVPLTDEMKSGKAPLRTFGDLLQFFDLKQQGGQKPQENRPSQKKPPQKPPESQASEIQPEDKPPEGPANDAPGQSPEANP